MVRTNRNIKLYSKIVVAWLSDFVARRTNSADATYELITDEVRHHYQVIRTGFLDDRFYYKVVFHLQLKEDAKLWILVNNTDLLLTDDLIQSGIPKSDIVIGFLPASVRAYTGFASV